MSEFAIGQSVARREDPPLLGGQGRFFDDLRFADQLYATIVRSPHAHADIGAIDTRAALKTADVHAVLDWREVRPRSKALLQSISVSCDATSLSKGSRPNDLGRKGSVPFRTISLARKHSHISPRVKKSTRYSNCSDDHFVTGLQQARSHAAAHVPQPDNSDFHDECSCTAAYCFPRNNWHRLRAGPRPAAAAATAWGVDLLSAALFEGTPAGGFAPISGLPPASSDFVSVFASMPGDLAPVSGLGPAPDGHAQRADDGVRPRLPSPERARAKAPAELRNCTGKTQGHLFRMKSTIA